MKVIRLGVAGYGHRISSFIGAVLRKAEPAAFQAEIRVAGIVDPDEAGARARLDECDRKDVVFYKSLDEMARRARLDGLLIGTRCNLHAFYAIQAARYDIPVFLEKPVAVSMRQALDLENAYSRAKSPPVAVSFPLRVSPLCVQARRLIRDGAVGSAEHIAAGREKSLAGFIKNVRPAAKRRGCARNLKNKKQDKLDNMKGKK
ncbi:MAG: Gfo/Idh/MocA family oxidoreductase [Kiritimatiellae bacterium]|nr:Gfo/Idh/MocA family oxidoreductase [Kiritimatiellia bacterium]